MNFLKYFAVKFNNCYIDIIIIKNERLLSIIIVGLLFRPPVPALQPYVNSFDKLFVRQGV
jgi:hypothetical protein